VIDRLNFAITCFMCSHSLRLPRLPLTARPPARMHDTYRTRESQNGPEIR
jgi:hypothetical protein